METVGGYRLGRRLGSGGMGTVHEALDADGRRVAIKVLHPAIGADPAARDRLRREVALLHRVRGAGVAQVLDAEVDGPDAFVVTELVDGPSLEESVRTEGPYTPEELAELARGLAEGLRRIHAAGVTHRDLKPGNIMLAEAGPVIIDFGIAQIADDVRLTQTGMVTGTPGYLDPEVLSGADPGPDGDWWAWAAVLTYAATGRPPFGTGPMQAVLSRVTAGTPDTEGLEPATELALRAALDPDPRRRPDPQLVLETVQGRWPTAELRGMLGADESSAGPGATRTLPPRYPPVAATRAYPSSAGEPGYGWMDDGRLGSGRVDGDHIDGAEMIDGVGPIDGAGMTAGASGVDPIGLGPDASWQDPPWQVAQWPESGPHHGPWPGGELEGSTTAPPAWTRPPRARPFTAAACALGLATLAAWYPGVWAVLIATLLAVLGVVGRVDLRRRSMRLSRGLRRGDTARALLGLPWHVVMAVVAVAPAVVVAGLVAAGTWLAAVAGFGLPEPPVLAVAALLATMVAWLLPTSHAAKVGTRVVLGAVRRPGRLLIGGLGLLAALVVVGLVFGGVTIEPAWDPLPRPRLP